MTPVAESAASNLRKIGYIAIHDHVRPAETNIPVDHSSGPSENPDRSNPIAPSAGAAQIAQVFIAVPALRAALVIRAVVDTNAFAQLLIGICLLIGVGLLIRI